MGAGLNNWVYLPNELASHIPSSYLVRLKNFEYTPTNTLTSRKGLEPVKYCLNPPDPEEELDYTQGLIAPTFDYTIQQDQDYFLNNIGTHTLALLGDSLVFTGINASSFHIIPFSLTSEKGARNPRENVVFPLAKASKSPRALLVIKLNIPSVNLGNIFMKDTPIFILSKALDAT